MAVWNWQPSLLEWTWFYCWLLTSAHEKIWHQVHATKVVRCPSPCWKQKGSITIAIWGKFWPKLLHESWILPMGASWASCDRPAALCFIHWKILWKASIEATSFFPANIVTMKTVRLIDIEKEINMNPAFWLQFGCKKIALSFVIRLSKKGSMWRAGTPVHGKKILHHIVCNCQAEAAFRFSKVVFSESAQRGKCAHKATRLAFL